MSLCATVTVCASPCKYARGFLSFNKAITFNFLWRLPQAPLSSALFFAGKVLPTSLFHRIAVLWLISEHTHSLTPLHYTKSLKSGVAPKGGVEGSKGVTEKYNSVGAPLAASCENIHFTLLARR